MKKPSTTSITEALATRHLYDYLRFSKTITFKDSDILKDIMKRLMEVKIFKNF